MLLGLSIQAAPLTLPHSNSNLWNALRSSFQLKEEYQRPEVQEQIQWLIEHPQYFERVTSHAAPYLYYILQELRKRNMPGELALLPMIESDYNPLAHNAHSGAIGLWQIIPSTGLGYGLQQDSWFDGRKDIYKSTHAALSYLNYLSHFFHGNWSLAVAAYDAGEGTVQQAVRSNSVQRKSTDFWSLRLPKETKVYWPRLLALATIINHPDNFPIPIPYTPNKPYFTRLDVGTQINLYRAAELAGMSYAEFAKLNPGHSRGAMSPEGPYTIVLPLEYVDDFMNRLNHEKIRSNSTTAQYYQIKKGDSLSQIAQDYHVTVNQLISWNQSVKARFLKPGHTIVINV